MRSAEEEEKRLREKVRALKEKIGKVEASQPMPSISSEPVQPVSQPVSRPVSSEDKMAALAAEAVPNANFDLPLAFPSKQEERQLSGQQEEQKPFKAPPSSPTKIPSFNSSAPVLTAKPSAPAKPVAPLKQEDKHQTRFRSSLLSSQQKVSSEQQKPVEQKIEKKEKKGLFGGLFANKKKQLAAQEQTQRAVQRQAQPIQAQAIDVAAAAKKQEVPVKELATSQASAAKELAKAHDTEVEAIVNDLMGKAIQEAKAAEAVPPGVKQPPVHRRYLLYKQQREEKERAKSAQAQGVQSQEQAQKQEYQEMVSEVYTQYKSLEPTKEQKTEEAKKAAAAKPEEKKEEKPLSPRELRVKAREDERKAAAAAKSGGSTEKTLSLEELVGGPSVSPAASTSASSTGGGLFDQLGAITGGSNARTDAAKPSSSTAIPAQPAPGTVCPTCKTANTRVIFCPYCGAGMCANCSPNVKVEGDNLIYVCPKCQEDVTVRKK